MSACADGAAAPPPILSSRNAECTARCAAAALPSSTTTEMFSSDAPWAIAITFTCASAIAAKRRAATPRVPDIPRPTIATIARSARTSMPSISSRSSCSENAARNASLAARAEALGTTRQIECSEDACEMSATETPTRSSAPNARAAMPGTPTMPSPEILMIACAPIAVIARTGYRFSVALSRRVVISVPGESGSASGRMKRCVASRSPIRARG